uniref:Nonstructural protein n=1 Tax=Bird deltacoronavirus CalidrisCN24 TaxID=3237949 RepID=A0AB39AFU6_9NIDO
MCNCFRHITSLLESCRYNDHSSRVLYINDSNTKTKCFAFHLCYTLMQIQLLLVYYLAKYSSIMSLYLLNMAVLVENHFISHRHYKFLMNE